MGNSWSYVPHDHYKSTTELIHLLVKIVSRGGNLLLNIGRSPEGDWDDTAYSRLKEIGDWMKTNGEGIYNSKPVAPYSSGNSFFTQSKDGRNIYVFYLGEKTDIVLPRQVVIEGFAGESANGLPAAAKRRVSLMGRKGELRSKQEGNKLIITIPAALQHSPAGQHAVVFKVSY